MLYDAHAITREYGYVHNQ